jgi:hypothetical protein
MVDNVCEKLLQKEIKCIIKNKIKVLHAIFNKLVKRLIKYTSIFKCLYIVEYKIL